MTYRLDVPVLMNIPRFGCVLLLGLMIASGHFGGSLLGPQRLYAAETSEKTAVGEFFAEADQILVSADDNRLRLMGNARLKFSDRTLEADLISVDRYEEKIVAEGQVTFWQGEDLIIEVEKFESADDLSFATAIDIKMRLNGRAHIFAKQWSRDSNGDDQFAKAIYTTCEICSDGQPTWKVRVNKVHSDKAAKRHKFYGFILDIGLVPVLFLPYISVPDSGVARASGLLAPEFVFQNNLGFLISQPYYGVLGPSSDVTVSPLIGFTSYPGLDIEFRQAFENANWKVVGNVQPKIAKSDQIGAYISSSYSHKFPYNFNLKVENSYALDHFFHPRFGVYPISHPLFRNSVNLSRLGSYTWLDLSLDRHDLYKKEKSERLYAYATPSVHLDGSVELPNQWGQVRYNFDLGNRFTIDTARQSRLISEVGYTNTHRLFGGFLWHNKFDLRVDLYENKRLRELHNKKIAWRVIPQGAGELSYPLLITAEPSQSNSDFVSIFSPFFGVSFVHPFTEAADSYSFDIYKQDSFSVNRYFTGNGIHNRSSGYDLVDQGLRLDYGVRYSGWLGKASWRVGIDQSYLMDPVRASKARTGIQNGFDRLGLSGEFSVPYLTADFLIGLDIQEKPKPLIDVDYAYANLGINVASFGFTSRFYYQEAEPALNRGERRVLEAGVTVRPFDRWSITTKSSWNLIGGFALLQGSAGLTYQDSCFRFELSGYQGFDEYGARNDNFGVKALISLQAAPESWIKISN